MRVIVIIILIYSVILPQTQTDIPWPTLADSPWPMIKHDPQLTGRSPYKGPQTPTIVWTADMKNGIYSGPVIGADDNLYFGSYFQDPFNVGLSDTFYCFYPTGVMNWAFKLGTAKPPQTGIVVDSAGNIYFGSMDQFFYALKPDGTLKWKYSTDALIGERAIPNIDLDGNLYITSWDGYLYSFTPAGILNWRVDYGLYAQRSPAISPDGTTLYIGAMDSCLYAINQNGTVKWKLPLGNIEKAPMVDNEGNIYVIPDRSPQYLYSIFPDGNIRWKYHLQSLGNLDLYSIPVIDKNGNISFIALDTENLYYRALISIDYEGNFRWRYELDDEEMDDFWQPLICDNEGTIYFGSTFGYSYYAVSSNGILKWKLPLEFDLKQVDHTGAIARDGTLYIGVHEGSLAYGHTKTLYAIKDTGSVGVGDNRAILTDYFLEQNYPNPFNPSTTIKYSIPEAAFVRLSVYNMLGVEIKNLVNEKQSAGSFSYIFDASGLPSGVYLYKLQTPVHIEVKKMTLVK